MTKKYRTIPALLAVLACLSCQEKHTETGDRTCELTFGQETLPFTKGVVEGTDLTDNVTGTRPIYITAYLHPQSGTEENYFVNEEFSLTAGQWKHDPAVYWPMEARMDFLAYSSTTPFDPFDITFGTPNNAERMIIAVGNDRIHDDILYGAKWNSAKPSSGATTMTMKHTQANIVFNLKKKSGTDGDCIINKIVLKNIYLEGDLIIENNYGVPGHRWNFRRYRADDTIMDDTAGIYGIVLTTTETSISMLIPEQEMKSIEIHYSVNGETKVSTKELPHENWLGGRKYIYDLSISGVDPMAAYANGHDYVDLGLRSGGNKILFATCNIGANSPEEYGDYYAWGDVVKRYSSITESTVNGYSFNLNNYLYANEYTKLTKYSDDKPINWGGEGMADFLFTLEPSDDVATIEWGGNWRMPDKTDLQYLHSTNVTYSWTNDYNSTGIKGVTITGKSSFSDAFIFLPAAGQCSNNNRNDTNNKGCYISRSLNEDNPYVEYDICFYFNTNTNKIVFKDDKIARYIGNTIRPVLVVPE